MKVLLFIILASLISCASENTQIIKTEKIEQNLNGTTYKAQVFYPSTSGKKATIIVVHEWWGHNEYARSRAKMLADQGYVAISIDMYGNDKIAIHPKDAVEFSNEALKNPQMAFNRFNKAIEYLKGRSDVNADKIGAIGYCFGGSVVLNMARMGADLQAVAIFHGGLKPVTKNNRKINAKIAVFNGADDPMTTAQDIKNFKAEMKAKNVDYIFKSYKGAKHAFTNPNATEYGKKFNLPLAYNAEADKKSWKSMLEFFQKYL